MKLSIGDQQPICYVLGSNPQLSIMDGHFRRILGNKGIDKVALVNNGVFLVRFQSEESKIKTVEEGVQMFDKMPVVIKPWKQDIDMKMRLLTKFLYGLDSWDWISSMGEIVLSQKLQVWWESH